MKIKNKYYKINIHILAMLILVLFISSNAGSFNSYNYKEVYNIQDAPYVDRMWNTTYYITNKSTLEAIHGGTCTRVKTQAWALTPNGTLCCLIQGSFSGQNSVMYISKSFDNGSTWQYPETFINSCFEEPAAGFACNTINDFDRFYANRTYLMVSYQSASKHHYVIWTEDNAASWVGLTGSEVDSNAIDITQKASIPNDFQSSGTGVVMSNGRMVLTVVDNDGAGDMQICSVYSDDVWGGNATSVWTLSPTYGNGSEYTEGSLVEVYNHSLFLDIRDYQGNLARPQRLYYGFTNGDARTGPISWQITASEDFYYYPNQLNCEEYVDAARLTINTSSDKNRILIAWNNHTFNGDAETSRLANSVAVSYDEGLTWAYTANLSGDDYEAHPKLIVSANNTILVGYKEDYPDDVGHWSYENWVHQFNLEYLTNGYDILPEDSREQIQFISINNKSNGTSISYSTPIFNWTYINNTAQYWLQIANDSAFSDLVVDLSNINYINYPIEYKEEANVSFTLPYEYRLTEYKKYYCRVRGYSI